MRRCSRRAMPAVARPRNGRPRPAAPRRAAAPAAASDAWDSPPVGSDRIPRAAAPGRRVQVEPSLQVEPNVTIRCVIVDDEPPARDLLRAMLAEHRDVEVVAEYGSGAEAVEGIERERPDLVFLDIQMPEGNGFDVIGAIGPDEMPPVMFVTAYDQYALKAFEVHALDYLLKPFDRKRLALSVGRARD